VISRIFFQDVPSPGIFKKKNQDFPEDVGTLKTKMTINAQYIHHK